MRPRSTKLCHAYNHLKQNKGAKLVLTNADQDVWTDIAICPGEGALAAPLLTVQPDAAICGKPETILLELVVSECAFISIASDRADCS